MRRTGRGAQPDAVVARSKADVEGLVAGVELAQLLLQARLNELLDQGYSYAELATWLGVSRKTFYRRYVEVQQRLI